MYYKIRIILPFFVLFILLTTFALAGQTEGVPTNFYNIKVLIDKKHFSQALVEIDNEMKKYPNNDELHYLSGIVYFSIGSKRKAMNALINATSINPKNSNAHTKLGNLYIEANNIKEAKRCAEAALTVSPKSLGALMLIANVNIKEKQYDQALGHLDKGIEVDPANYKLKISKASVLLIKGDLAGAEKLYLEAKANEPTYPIAYTSLSRLYNLKSEFGKAESELIAMVKATNNSLRSEYELARFYEESRQWDKAEKIYLSAVETAKYNDTVPMVKLAGYNRRRGAHKQATNIITKALEKKVNAIDLLVGLAQIYLETEELDKADLTIDRALKQDKEYLAANYLKGKIFFKRNSFKDALKLYGQILLKHPSEYRAHLYSALCHRGLGSDNQAIDHLLKAIELNSNMIEARLILAEIYLSKKYIDLADLEIDYVLHRNPKSLIALLLKGDVALIRKDKKTAEQFYHRAVELHPESAPAYYKLGLLYNLEKDENRSLAALGRAIDYDPGYVDALALATGIYTRMKRYDKAINLLNESIQQTKNTPVQMASMIYLKGNIYLAKQDYDQAKRLFEESISLDNDLTAAKISLSRLDKRN